MNFLLIVPKNFIEHYFEFKTHFLLVLDPNVNTLGPKLSPIIGLRFEHNPSLHSMSRTFFLST